ncbi:MULTISPECIES: SusE domain-containing protein [unclassified Flammeovirga]|uniref:SusE domain-containing protein n=1 Tax=unclassified Flammeovirga TaxID=2637820 RepID=UPI0006949D6A|nr:MULTISPECIES: SusE domain-containing protein [unclassified Flammeovirga]MBD0403420.1 SusE domain-containing protein [Flammeovirga sp. EKP202]
MKRILALAVLTASLFSCNNDKDLTQIGEDDTWVGPEITNAPEDKLYEFTAETQNEEFTTLEWSSADYGKNTEYKYNLIASVEGFENEEILTVATASSTSSTLLEKEVSKTINLITGVTDPAKVEEVRVSLRVESYIGEGGEDSPKLSSSFTSFDLFPYLGYQPTLWLAGNFNGWGHNDADVISHDEENQGNYNNRLWMSAEEEGQVIGGNFKISTEKGWGATNYGLGDEEGTLSDTGGDIPVGDPNLYDVKVNIDELTYELVPIEWGIIGDATPLGWDDETKMTLDPATASWSIIVDLKDGHMKFRANHTWDINLGAGDKDGELSDSNAPDIPVSAGRYKITLLLNTEKGTYTYTMEKQ